MEAADTLVVAEWRLSHLHCRVAPPHQGAAIAGCDCFMNFCLTKVMSPRKILALEKARELAFSPKMALGRQSPWPTCESRSTICEVPLSDRWPRHRRAASRSSSRSGKRHGQIAAPNRYALKLKCRQQG